MSQISPPLRIALAVAVLFGVVYMVALRPKAEPVATTPAPAATPAPNTASATDENTAGTGLGKAVEAARGAAAATEAKQGAKSADAGAATQSKPSTSSSKPAETTPAQKAESGELAALPAWLEKSMDEKVVAILFTNRESADDRRTEDALDRAYTAHGKVVTRAVPISRISKYRPVTAGVDVTQSPTLMVIDRDRAARTLVGYSNLEAVNQAVIDGLLATDNPVRRVEYLQTVQRECRQITNQAILGETGGSSIADARRNVDALIATEASSLGTLRNTPVPAAYRGLSRQVNQYIASELAAARTVRSTAFGSRFVDTVKARQIVARNDRLEHRVKLELNAVGVRACN